ncbi:hypothetical protein QNI16_38555 [Cytophagaceae bacterium YF14B1]|uniref:Uncharacterized protein n=1 Tax=Xanthocytophaga flava TaxID=3048013 RepID=A0AAE3UE43_9BACT|nr:hypothetical protein [Xanthocytophaga flavus]MDJ1486439.1 hypothetical protein [Xanthocytophaga flavus]
MTSSQRMHQQSVSMQLCTFGFTNWTEYQRGDPAWPVRKITTVFSFGYEQDLSVSEQFIFI